MKNIHVLPTDKPSNGYILGKCIKELSDVKIGQFTKTYYLMFDEEYFQPHNIYITSNEEIKKGDFTLSPINAIVKCECEKSKKSIKWDNCKKIILTDNQDLIKYGVQAIDDEFLEWFVKNPSCEWIEVNDWLDDKGNIAFNGKLRYQIIIPKEEPKQVGQVTEKGIIDTIGNCANCGVEFHIHKDVTEYKQETLEEAAERFTEVWFKNNAFTKELFIAGAKWQQEQDKNKYSEEEVLDILFTMSVDNPNNITKWFEQFKNK